MAQIDIITYSGQLVTTLASIAILFGVFGIRVRPITHTFIAYWSSLKTLTSSVSKDYYNIITKITVFFSNTFTTLVAHMIDTLMSYSLSVMNTLFIDKSVVAWKRLIQSYVVKRFVSAV